MDVEGTLLYSKNPACETLSPNWRWTEFPLDGLAAGPLRGPIYTHIGTSQTSRFTLWPVNGTAATATHVRVLLFVTQSTPSVGLYHSGGVGSCGNPNAGVYYSGYSVSGSHEVRVTRITTPIEVTAPNWVTKGNEAEFSVEPYGDLRWLNPSGAPPPQGRRSWYYLVGDTVGAQHEVFNGPFVSLTHCFDQPTCTYKPQVSGRVLVAGYVEGTYASWKSEIVRVGVPTLDLTCPAAVVRAQPMTCTASSSPSTAALEVQSWHFQPDPVIINPVAGPVNMGESVSELSSSTSWSGPLVLPGTVTVRAVVGSDALTATAQVAITERAWDTGNTWHDRIDPGWGGEHRPLTDSAGSRITAGQNVHFPTREEIAKYEGADDGPDLNHLVSITEGPNRGYQYFQQHTIRLNRGYRINKYITQANDHPDIRISGTMYTRWEALMQMGWGNPAMLFDAAVQHESFGTAGRVGHQDGFVQAITGDVCGNLARRLERVAGSPDAVRDAWLLVWGQAGDFINVAVSHHRVHGHVPPNTRFVMRSRSNPAPLHGTMPQDGRAPLAPLSFYAACDMAANLGV